MDIRNKYKQIYETDEWFDRILNFIKNYPNTIYEGDVTKEEKNNIILNCEKILKEFEGIKETPEYIRFKKSRAEFILNLFDALNSQQWENAALKKACEEINKEENIFDVTLLHDIYKVANPYAISDNILIMSDEVKSFYKKINKDIQDYSYKEILKYKIIDKIPEIKETTFERDYIEFMNFIQKKRYNPNIDYPSDIRDVLDSITIREFVKYDFKKENSVIKYYLNYSFANSISIYMFSDSFIKVMNENTSEDIDLLVNNISMKEFEEIKLYLNEIDTDAAEKFLKPWLKKIISKGDKNMINNLNITLDCLDFDSNFIKKIIYEVGYNLYQEKNDSVFLSLIDSKELKKFKGSMIEYDNFIKAKKIGVAWKKNENIVEMEEVTSKTISFNYQVIMNKLGSNHVDILNFLNAENLRVYLDIKNNKVYSTFLHKNIENVSDEQLSKMFNNLLYKAFFAVQEKSVKDMFENVVNSEINKMVLENILEKSSKKSSETIRKSKKI